MTKDGLVKLVLSDAEYREIETALDNFREKYDEKSLLGSARRAVLANVITNIGNQYRSQER